MAAVAVAAALAAIVLLIVGPGGHSRDRATQPPRPAALAPARSPRTFVVLAAHYLGISPAELRKQMLARSTPASIAETRGRSAAGLIKALLESRTARITQALASGRVSKKAAAARLARLRRRAVAFVNRAG